jgi:hypothetical protein
MCRSATEPSIGAKGTRLDEAVERDDGSAPLLLEAAWTPTFKKA